MSEAFQVQHGDKPLLPERSQATALLDPEMLASIALMRDVLMEQIILESSPLPEHALDVLLAGIIMQCLEGMTDVARERLTTHVTNLDGAIAKLSAEQKRALAVELAMQFCEIDRLSFVKGIAATIVNRK